MKPETVRYFGLILAANARIEGMKAANAVVDSPAYPIPYSENDFYCEAALIEQYALEVIQQ